MKLLLLFLFCEYFVAQNVVAKAAPSSVDAIVFRDDNDFESEDILESDGPNEIVTKRHKKEPKDLQLKGFFQGDIKLTEAQKSDFSSRTGVRSDFQKWPISDDGYAIVPYEIDLVYGL